MTYYVQIPCFITRDRPNRTATADRWLVVPVEADSQVEAIGKVEMALTVLVRVGPQEIGVGTLQDGTDDGC